MWEAGFGVFRPATNKGRRSIISARKIKVPSRKRTSHRSPISKGGINAGSFTSSPNFGTASSCGRVVVVVKLVLAVSLLFIVVASAVVVVFRPFFPSCLRFFLADPRLLRRRGEEEAVEDVVVVLVVLPLVPRRYLASSLCRSIYASTPRAVRDGKRAANRSVFCKP